MRERPASIATDRQACRAKSVLPARVGRREMSRSVVDAAKPSKVICAGRFR